MVFPGWTMAEGELVNLYSGLHLHDVSARTTAGTFTLRGSGTTRVPSQDERCAPASGATQPDTCGGMDGSRDVDGNLGAAYSHEEEQRLLQEMDEVLVIQSRSGTCNAKEARRANTLQCSA